MVDECDGPALCAEAIIEYVTHGKDLALEYCFVAIARETNEVEARLTARYWPERREDALQQQRLAIPKSLKLDPSFGSNASCPADDRDGRPQCGEEDSQRAGAIWHPDNPLWWRVQRCAPKSTLIANDATFERR